MNVESKRILVLILPDQCSKRLHLYITRTFEKYVGLQILDHRWIFIVDK